MKIATYNVNGIRARLDILLQWLQEEQPDVVCVQELKCPNDKFPSNDIAAAGYMAIWNGQKSWNGVAILARQQLIDEHQRVLAGDPEDLQSRYLEASINGIVIVCIYLPNGNPAPGPKFDYKLTWFKRLAKRTQELVTLDQPVVIAGDFNVIPTELDVYKPERWEGDALFRPEVRSAFEALLDQGWTDAIRTLYPDEVIYTFWDYIRNAYGRNAGLRIDHFLLNPSGQSLILSGGVDRHVRGWEKSSDHAPVWIKVDVSIDD